MYNVTIILQGNQYFGIFYILSDNKSEARKYILFRILTTESNILKIIYS